MSTLYMDSEGMVSARNFQKNKDGELIKKRPHKNAREAEVQKMIKEPYFAHIAYKDSDMLYIGKKGVPGHIVDWADKLAALYYQHDVFVGNQEYDLKFVRDIQIHKGNYVGYKDLFNRTIKKDESTNQAYFQTTDERLLSIINANRNNKKIHDIIETIQAEQYKIITENLEKSMIVHGCAGSGKTMVMMHRVRYLKYNNPQIDLENFIIISPTDILGRENKELAKILQMDKVSQYSIEKLYETSIMEYLNKAKASFLPFVVDNGVMDINNYKREVCEEKYAQLQVLLDYNSEEGRTFLNKEQEKVVRKITWIKEKINVPDNKFDAILEKYREAVAEIEEYSSVDLSNAITSLTEKVSKKAILEKRLYILQLLLDKQCFRENSKGQSLAHTLTFTDEIDVREMHKGGYCKNVSSLLELLQLMSLHFEGKTSVDKLKAILDEWQECSIRHVMEYTNAIKKELLNIKEYKKKLQILKVLQQLELFSTKEPREEITDDDFAKLKDYFLSIEELEELKKNPFVLLEQYDKCSEQLERIMGQQAANKHEIKKPYLFETLLYNCEIDYDEENVLLSLDQAFVICNSLAMMYDALTKKSKYIYVDEFQDCNVSEFDLLKKMYPNMVLNLYGDVHQCITPKGIQNLQEVDMLCEKIYHLKENYRNAREIAEYVKEQFCVEMRSIGIEGTVVSDANIFDVDYEEDDRVVMIVKDEGKSYVYAKETLQMEVVRYSETKKILPGIINIIDVEMIKGLEFEKVIVVKDGLSENEKYVAYTRSLEDLYLIDSLEDCEKYQEVQANNESNNTSVGLVGDVVITAENKVESVNTNASHLEENVSYDDDTCCKLHVKNTLLEIVEGSILDVSDVQAIVSPTNEHCMGMGIVENLIWRKAGAKLQNECGKFGPLDIAEVVATSGYNTGFLHILHVNRPKFSDDNSDQILIKCYFNILAKAAKLGIRSIGIPAISTNRYGFPEHRAAFIAVDVCMAFANKYPGYIDKIKFVLFDPKSVDAYQIIIKHAEKKADELIEIGKCCKCGKQMHITKAEFVDIVRYHDGKIGNTCKDCE